MGGVLCVGIDLGDAAEAWREAALPWVTAGERERSERFLHRLDGTRHLVGRALVRKTLTGAGGLAAPVAAFTTNPWGKPAWPGCGFEFSVAHSGRAVWVAFCREAAVGIDVEAVDPSLDLRDLLAALHPGERDELAVLPGPEARLALFRCWARKEAVLKALGQGLARPLGGFRVRTDGRGRDWLAEPPGDPVPGWTTVDLPGTGGHPGSVAALAPGLAVGYCRLEQPGQLR
jgi:4'-phosphopantetheinyl transferase